MGRADAEPAVSPPLLGELSFQVFAQALSGAVEARFHAAFGAVRDRGDFPVGQVFVMVQQERGLEFVREAIDGGAQLGKSFVVLEGLTRQGRVARQLIGEGLARLIVRGVKSCSGVTSPPTVVIMAEMGEDGVEPGGEAGVLAQALPLLVKADECFGDKVLGIGDVLEVAPGEGEEGALPALHDEVEGGVVAVPQGIQPLGVLGNGVGAHGVG